MTNPRSDSFGLGSLSQSFQDLSKQFAQQANRSINMSETNPSIVRSLSAQSQKFLIFGSNLSSQAGPEVLLAHNGWNRKLIRKQ